MAQKIQTILEDDIQGGEASQTVTFSYQGKDYEIDLNDKNADKMEKAFSFYVEHARRIGGRSAARRASRRVRTPRAAASSRPRASSDCRRRRRSVTAPPR